MMIHRPLSARAIREWLDRDIGRRTSPAAVAEPSKRELREMLAEAVRNTAALPIPEERP